jgi:hypothetical protein
MHLRTWQAISASPNQQREVARERQQPAVLGPRRQVQRGDGVGERAAIV